MLKTLDFGEFLIFKGLENYANSSPPFNKFSNYEYENLHLFYDEFIEYGGFPEVALTPNKEDKLDILHDIVNSYIYVDINSLAEIRDIENIRKLLKLLTTRISSKIIISKIASLTNISRVTVKNYLQFLEDTFFISRINVFSKSPEREISKAQKLFFSDNGLLIPLGKVSSGKLFENAVFNQLRHFGEHRYYSRKDGKEIDFLLETKFAFEVKERPDIYDLKNLKKLASSINYKNSFLIGRYRIDNFNDFIWGGSIR